MYNRVREQIRVLLVDDDPEFLEVARSHLSRETDLTIRSEREPTAGLEAVESEEIDCVVSDYRMPNVDGLEFLEALRDVEPNIPFILFTGRGSEEIASDAIRSGVDDYVLKSATPEPYSVLANRVRNAVEQSRAETSYREIFEHSAVGMTVYDPDSGGLQAANRHYYDMLGYDSEPDADLSLPAVLAGEEASTEGPDMAALRADAQNGGKTFEVPERTAAGDQIWIQVQLRTVEIGGRERLLGAIREITDRKERERRTQRIRRVTRDLMTAETDDEIARIAVGAAEELIDLPYCGVYLHDETEATLAPATISGSDETYLELSAFVSGDGASAIDDLVWSAFGSGEARLIDATTEPLGNGQVGTLLVDPLGDHGVFVAAAEQSDAMGDTDRSLLDILTANTTAALDRAERETALREREEELARQNERLEEFAGVVSHDLRDPLEAAYGHLELAAVECDTDHHDGLRDMLDRMADVVEDALTLARHGQAVVDPEPVELGDVLDVAWDTANRADATLRVTDDLRPVCGDRSRITQLLGNLLRNAVEHGGQTVTVRVGTLDNGFFVEDDGPGIPPDDRESVFSVGVSSGDDGAGLGLAIVEQIADAHGWTVSARSGRDGGARFEITGVEWA